MLAPEIQVMPMELKISIHFVTHIALHFFFKHGPKKEMTIFPGKDLLQITKELINREDGFPG